MWFPPLRRCFGTAAGLKLSVTKEGQSQATALAYTLKQFDRYRATLQIGVAASDLHQQTFGLRQDGTVKHIIETVPMNADCRRRRVRGSVGRQLWPDDGHGRASVPVDHDSGGRDSQSQW